MGNFIAFSRALHPFHDDLFTRTRKRTQRWLLWNTVDDRDRWHSRQHFLSFHYTSHPALIAQRTQTTSLPLSFYLV